MTSLAHRKGMTAGIVEERQRVLALIDCGLSLERLRAAIADGESVEEFGDTVTRSPDPIREELARALEWYGEQARLARLIHSEGDAGRHALADDGGKRARAALLQTQRPQERT